jgi:epoxyqueuosine reductase QueG
VTELTGALELKLREFGADVACFGDLSELPPDVRGNMPVGVSVIAAYPKEVILGIIELPNSLYFDWYTRLNEQLDEIVTRGAELLRAHGYTAVAQTRTQVRKSGTYYNTILPHKTVATRAGAGWIGKCALLVTEQYGSAVRLSSILTDAPLCCSEPINNSRCGDCTVCRDACPAGAVTGNLWTAGIDRIELYDHLKCAKTATEQAAKAELDDAGELCGRCIAVCPQTQRYLKG